MEMIIFILIVLSLWIIIAPLSGIAAQKRVNQLDQEVNILRQKIQSLENSANTSCYDRHLKEFYQTHCPQPTQTEAIIQSIVQKPSKLPTTMLDDPHPKQQHQLPQTAAQSPNNWINKSLAWFNQGNVPVKVGMLILLFGVGSLLKYALDQSWFTMTHALIITAAIASAAFAFAYIKRNSHRLFSLTVQGGSIGVLLLTLFAASKLEQLITLNIAFALSFALIAATAILSVRQNAIALAIFAIFSGFMAPIWLSSGSNNYIALFSYYALLNFGIIAIAWFKPWQRLNLLGFIFTFGVGITWGVLKYEPHNFNTTEPFLILFFTLYLIIPIFYANRMKDHKEKIVDAFLIFGNPLLSLLIQAHLLDYSKTPLMINAWLLAGIYGALAFAVHKVTHYRLLKISYMALCWLFVILAIPLAFIVQQTSIIYALFAALLFWWSEKTRNPYAQVISGLFYILSIFAILLDLPYHWDLIAYTPNYIILALTAFFMTYQCILHQRKSLEKIMLANGLFFWCLAGILQILDSQLHYWIITISLFFAVTAIIIAFIYSFILKKLGAQFLYPKLAFMLLIVGAFIYLIPLSGTLLFSLSTQRWFDGGFLLWYLFAAMFWMVFWLLRHEYSHTASLAQLLFWCFNLFMLSYDFNGLAHILVSSASEIQLSWIFIAIPLIAAYWIYIQKPRWLTQPFATNELLKLESVQLTFIIILACIWAILLTASGSLLILPIWLPIFNLYDLIQLALSICIIHYLWRSTNIYRTYWIAGISLITLTLIIVRACYFYLGLSSWSLKLLENNNIQLTLTIIWSLLGFCLWIYGSKKRHRFIWNVGAALMGIVLLKLLLIDRTNLGNVTGIASFIGYGLFCLVIGYFAPQPPKNQSL